jgi:hypothetical protein
MRHFSRLASTSPVVFVLFGAALAAGCGEGAVTSTTGGGGSGGQTGGATIEGAPTCSNAEERIDVALGGKDDVSKVLLGGVAVASDGFQMPLGKYGALYVRTLDGSAPGALHTVTSALLRMPEDSDDPGTWYCGGAGSQAVIDSDFQTFQVLLRSVSSLGKCPGKPVEGGMEVCFPGQPCPPGISSTVAGASFDALLDGYESASGPFGGSEAKIVATIKGGGGHILLQATSIDPKSADVQTATLGLGTVTIPDGQPDAGAVYCIGKDSTLEYKISAGGPAPLHATLKNLSRLGACPGMAASGQIGLCMNMHE